MQHVCPWRLTGPEIPEKLFYALELRSSACSLALLAWLGGALGALIDGLMTDSAFSALQPEA
jgi:hypothetical protein